MTNNTFIFLTHAQLVNIFKGGYCYSLSDQKEFEYGVDEYIIPSIMKDEQFRVLGIKSQDPQDLAKMKSDFTEYVKKHFWEYFHTDNWTFKEFHNNACDDMIQIFSKRYNNVKYGKAQKAVNMIFKYFYCFADSENYENKFSDCHMPLDSKILEWYRKGIDKKQKTPWSYIDKEEYDTIQEEIEKHIDVKYSGGYNVLQAEFVIWDEAINTKAATL